MRILARFGVLLATCCLLSNPCYSQLLGITWDRGGELYSISTIDASVKLIGRTGLTLPESLDFGPDGRLYTTTNGVPSLTSELYVINPQTAEAALIGPTGVAQFEGALAFAPMERPMVAALPTHKSIRLTSVLARPRCWEASDRTISMAWRFVRTVR